MSLYVVIKTIGVVATMVALWGTAGASSAAFKDLWLSLAMGILQHVPPVLVVAWAHKQLGMGEEGDR